MNKENPLLVVLGPTASGKTRLAARLAAALGGEILSADSRQLFKGMDIGTGKDLKEYTVAGKVVPYHLIDIREAGQRYNVHEFKEDFYRVYAEIRARGALPVLCGGTGMYIHSILQRHELTAVPVDEELRQELSGEDIGALRGRLAVYPEIWRGHADLSSHKRLVRAIEVAEYLRLHGLEPVERPLFAPYVVGLRSEVTFRRARILERLEKRLEEGLVEEVQGLLDSGVPREALEFYGLEYKYVTAYLFGELDDARLLTQLGTAICQFAKRQMTFFRKMEKDGVKIKWFDTEDGHERIFEQVMAALACDL